MTRTINYDLNSHEERKTLYTYKEDEKEKAIRHVNVLNSLEGSKKEIYYITTIDHYEP